MTAVKYIILFQGRTGSTFLVDALRSHPAIVCRGELLTRVGKARGWKATLDLAVRKLTPSERQIRWLEGLYGGKYPETIQAVGMKTKLSVMLDLHEFAEYLEASDIRVIVMKRENLVKQAISFQRAHELFRATGEWNRKGDAPALPPSRISLAEFDNWLRKVTFDHRMIVAFSDRLSNRKLMVEYSDLMRDQTASLDRIATFLEVSGAPLVSRVVKNTPDDLSLAVTNIAELRDAYRDTEYGPMFDGV